MNKTAARPPAWPVRILWLLTGVAWAARSAISFTGAEYRDPDSPLEWSAVLVYSAAWLLTAPSVLAIGRMAGRRSVMIVAWIAAVGAMVVGLVNAIEDGMGVDALATTYVVSFLVAWAAIFLLATAMLREKLYRLAGLCAALFLGVGLFPVGGGAIVLLALGSIALAPGWYAQDIAALPTEPATVLT